MSLLESDNTGMCGVVVFPMGPLHTEEDSLLDRPSPDATRQIEVYLCLGDETPSTKLPWYKLACPFGREAGLAGTY